MRAWIYPLCAGLSWALALARLPRLRGRWRDPSAVAVGALFAANGLGFTCASPQVLVAVRALARQFGFGDVTSLWLHLVRMVFLCVPIAVLFLLLSWTTPAGRLWSRRTDAVPAYQARVHTGPRTRDRQCDGS